MVIFMATGIKKVETKSDNIVPEKNQEVDTNVEPMGLIEDIFGPSIDDGYNLLRDNGINYQKEDIKSVERRGTNGENIAVITTSGDAFLFKPDGDGFVLSSITMSDGKMVHCDLSESLQEGLRDITDIHDDVEIKGYAIISINGQTTKVYWVGDGVDFDVFKKSVTEIQAALEKYPSNVVGKVLNNSNFKGFFIGKPDDVDANMPGYNNGLGYVAYAHNDEFIYVNSDCSPNIYTIEHEFAHIFDSTLTNGKGHYTENDSKIKTLYNKYKKVIQEIMLNGYTSSNYPDGVPSVVEFLACAVPIYLEHPNDLKELMPEVYDYIKELFSSI